MSEGHGDPAADVRAFLPRPDEPVEQYAERLRALHRDLTLVLQAVERGLAAGGVHGRSEEERGPGAAGGGQRRPAAHGASARDGAPARAGRRPAAGASTQALAEPSPVAYRGGGPRVEVVEDAGDDGGDDPPIEIRPAMAGRPPAGAGGDGRAHGRRTALPGGPAPGIARVEVAPPTEPAEVPVKPEPAEPADAPAEPEPAEPADAPAEPEPREPRGTARADDVPPRPGAAAGAPPSPPPVGSDRAELFAPPPFAPVPRPPRRGMSPLLIAALAVVWTAAVALALALLLG